jgi:hypothetical protein
VAANVVWRIVKPPPILSDGGPDAVNYLGDLVRPELGEGTHAQISTAAAGGLHSARVVAGLDEQRSLTQSVV